MEKKHPSIYYLTYGIISGVAAIIIFLLNYAFIGVSGWLQILSYVVFIILMYLAAKEARDKIKDGYITYGNSLGITFLTGLVGAFIMGVFVFIYVKYINTGYLQETIDETRMVLIQKFPNMTDQQIDQTIDFQSRLVTPFITSISNFFSFTFFSFIFALIVSIFVKKNKPVDEF
ncbi:MAG: DUF4199 domain-containing protein [Bacteroidales bacterium]